MGFSPRKEPCRRARFASVPLHGTKQTHLVMQKKRAGSQRLVRKIVLTFVEQAEKSGAPIQYSSSYLLTAYSAAVPHAAM
jgi:hypothetical protein